MYIILKWITADLCFLIKILPFYRFSEAGLLAPKRLNIFVALLVSDTYVFYSTYSWEICLNLNVGEGGEVKKTSGAP